MNIPNPSKYNELLSRVAYLRERVDSTLETHPELWDSDHYLTPEAVRYLKEWISEEHYWTFNHWSAYSPEEIDSAYSPILERITKLGERPDGGVAVGDEEDGDDEW
jgi:hypothetical protein